MIGENRYRALFLSDFHLGSKHCQVERLQAFLDHNTADRIYLIGDVFDHVISLFNLKKTHRAILSTLAKKAFNRTEIIYIPGNHDSIFRHYIGKYGLVTVARRYMHDAKHGKNFLVTHGDETDMFGLSWTLRFLITVERLFPISLWEVCRKFLGPLIRTHTHKFEQKMRKEAAGFAGVICGHIHQPSLTVGYMNSGDWVHHCTAIAEHYNGKFELLQG